MNTTDPTIFVPRICFAVPHPDDDPKNEPPVCPDAQAGPAHECRSVIRRYQLSLLPLVTLLVFIGVYGSMFRYNQYILQDHPVSGDSNGVSDFLITAAIYDNVPDEEPVAVSVSQEADHDPADDQERLAQCVGETPGAADLNSFAGLGRLLHDRFSVALVVSRRLKDRDLGIDKVDTLSLIEITELLDARYNIVYDAASRKVLISERMPE